MTIKNLSHPRALDDYVIHIDAFELKKRRGSDITENTRIVTPFLNVWGKKKVWNVRFFTESQKLKSAISNSVPELEYLTELAL